MSDSNIPDIQSILTELDRLLRERLAETEIDIGHALLATSPDGDGAVRSTVGPAELGDMTELLAEIASGVALERPEDELLN